MFGVEHENTGLQINTGTMGEGDVGFFADIYAVCRKHGREDSILVLSTRMPDKDAENISNTLNPFQARE